MSAITLADVAKQRDLEPPGKEVKSAAGVLAASVPSETLAAYTALVGVVLGADIGSGYGAFRWWAYAVFIALAMLAPLAIYKRRVKDEDAKGKETRPVPGWECLVAGFAAAAWGLVMPGGPLSLVVQGNALVFATAGIALGGATLLALAAELLGKANDKNPAGGDVGPAEQALRAAEPDRLVPDGVAAAAGGIHIRRVEEIDAR